MVKNQLPITDVSHLIPQKSPFVMVDTLLDFSSETLISNFKIPKNNLFVNNNIFLEPGLIENMAQTVALHTGYDYFLKGKEAPTGYIGAIKKVQILTLPKTEEIITTKVSILHELMGVTMVNITVFNEKKIEIASSEMKTVIAN